MTSNTTTDSTSPTSLNSPLNSPSTTINNGNETQTQIHHPSSPPTISPSTPTPQLSTSLPSNIIQGDIDPSIDVSRSAASISNLINHDHDDDDEQKIITSPNSHPTSQMSSRSISPAPDTPHNTNNSMDFELHNTNIIKKKRKGSHDNDENDINNKIGDFDSSKRQRCNLKNLSLSIDGNSVDITKVSDHGSAPSSPITGFDDMNIDDHNSDEYSGANSPTNSSIGAGPQISSTSPTGNNLNFPTKQTRKKPYIPRPPNSFILYRQHHHPLILNQHPGINNSEISRIIADHWRNLPNPEKEEWKRKADEAKQRHMKAWPDYKYQPRRRVVGPTFKKPLKGPDTPTSATKSEFNAQEGSMMVIELSPHKKSDRNEIGDRHRFQRNSVIIIEGGSKELKDRNGNNNSKKLSPTEAIKSKLGTPTHQHSTYPTQRLPLPSPLVPHQLQSLPSSQQPPQSLVLPTTPSSTSTSTPSCGALIVLEGCEDTNTTLQSNQLYEFLKNEGIKAKLWKFPDTSTPSGSALKAYQSTNRQPHLKTLHLLVAAHWWELMPIMKEHLMNGITLIVDRYVYYATAESAAAGLDLHWCKSSYSQVLTPDLIFFLNMEREVNEIDKQQLSLPHVNDVLGIGNNDSDDGRKEWQRRIQDSLSRLAEVQWKVLDARKSSNIINAQIITASIEVIERCRKSNPGYGNMFNINNSIMSHQNQQLPPLVNGSPSPLSHQQQQNSNVLPPIGRRDGFSRPVHVQL
ncbi:unnamed protein product [Rhizophagus irregularis]|uniref:HMG box domain-containing protein n=2 Tax=Rhizophagus irregularis TaxID=588596 RepID=A0A2I1GZI9_9GLOM|nr:bifunctional thymidylate/uridylate kinase [Rhizophagus irregularis DAOM 197198w]PKY52011.1 hypothetical protein RhiirA4_407951 [Rhizophagus irregularis]GBC31468.2 thymidylate kinase isoform X2 [Rhizophagus irregularis DAOM 181602=DAOM 197198]UZO24085.1 hypothetical protein OCT59_016403 [Rhizophagus irregularis]CAB4376036.1 unnamed protein product [Rhizophagus irregularis]